jgi:hypothetical protein
MIYLIGGAGNGNFGDELIVRGWLEFLRERQVPGPVTCDENYAGISRDFFGARFPDAGFGEAVNRLKARGPDTFYAAFSRGMRFYENGGFERHPDLVELAAAFEELRVLHLHGGGYINTIWPRNGFLLGFAAATRKRYGCRLVGTGLGLMPVAAPPELYLPLLREAVAAFDLLEVRDRWSFDYLRRISDAPQVVLGLDDSFLLDPEPPAEPGPRTLHLSWFASAGGFETVLDLAAGPPAQGFERVLFWACIDRDMGCFERLSMVCPRAEAVAWQALVEGPIPVRPGDHMVTARFHPHLIAARYGATGAYRVDRGYYDVKQGSVVDLGSPFRAIGEAPIEAVPAAGARGFSAIHRLDAARVAAKRRLAAWIYEELLGAAPGPRAAAGPAPLPDPLPA